jgi:N-acetylglucosamine kinase-like BadF-type ATPase
VDTGGTSLRVAVAQAVDGGIVGESRGASAPDGGPGTVSDLIQQALQSAGVPADAVFAICVGATKVSRVGVLSAWQQSLSILFPTIPLTHRLVVPDYVIAFHGALPDGVGITAVAGTGSVFYGEDGRGGAIRVGGRGWEYGDEGSGTWLTTEMIRRTLRALDGLEKITPMTEAVCDSLETRQPAALGETARQRSEKEGRGFLAPLAFRLAQEGSTEAANLFVGAAGWLAAYCGAAKSRLNFPESSPIRVATIGGMWEVGDLLLTPFREVLPRFIPEAVIMPPEAAPVVGAVRLAVRAHTTIYDPR